MNYAIGDQTTNQPWWTMNLNDNKPIKWNMLQRDQATNPLSWTTNPVEQQT